MTLHELGAYFVRYEKRDERETHVHVGTLAEAQGVTLLCPGCYARNGGEVGTHSIVCWFRDRGVPDEAFPKPGRWAASGSGLDDLTLSPSVDVGCWHAYITNGRSS